MGEKVYFNPGDLVQLRQDVSNKPDKMLVDTVDMISRVEDTAKRLLGVTCIWFTSEGQLQKCRFNSKDLIHVR